VSRAFVKDDAERAPLVPSRPPLPPGTRNLVTPRGLRLLQAELDALVRELSAKERTDVAGHAESVALRARIAELEARLASAELVDPAKGAMDVVRFGARVTIRALDGTGRAFRIVGIDEANAAEGRVAFVAPVARALLGKRVGDGVVMTTPRGDDEVEILAIDFQSEP
jgi:transcription elongation factor GreB